MNKTPVSNRNVQGSLIEAPHVTEDSEAATVVHVRKTDSGAQQRRTLKLDEGAVLGMDAQSGDGELFGEGHGREATGQEEKIPNIPGDEADQGEENPEGADETGGVEEISDGEAEDMAPKRISPDPGLPTQAEVDDHEVDHVPFRRWCEECVAGRGTGEQHRSRDGPHAVPTIALD